MKIIDATAMLIVNVLAPSVGVVGGSVWVVGAVVGAVVGSGVGTGVVSGGGTRVVSGGGNRVVSSSVGGGGTIVVSIPMVVSGGGSGVSPQFTKHVSKAASRSWS